MLTSIPIALTVGTVLGYLAGLGVGGGSLLILWLTLITNTDPSVARMINLMFFITAAGSVSLIRWKKGNLNLKKILPAIITGCICATLASTVSNQISPQLIQKIFGILLLITGIRELFYRPRNER